jgi:hypothetical protein
MTATALKDLATIAPANDVGASRSDAELAQLALTNDAAVWSEVVERFEPVVRHQLGRTLAAGSKLTSSDSVDDALGEFWVALLKDDRAWLRRFDPSRDITLATWLGVLAWDVGNKHLRRLRRNRSGRPMDDLDLDHQPWTNAGALFLGRLNTIQPDPPAKSRRFGSR